MDNQADPRDDLTPEMRGMLDAMRTGNYVGQEPIIPRSSVDLIIPQIDITAPDHAVQIEIDHQRHVVYVHVNGLTVLRICRTQTIELTQVGSDARSRT